MSKEKQNLHLPRSCDTTEYTETTDTSHTVSSDRYETTDTSHAVSSDRHESHSSKKIKVKKTGKHTLLCKHKLKKSICNKESQTNIENRELHAGNHTKIKCIKNAEEMTSIGVQTDNCTAKISNSADDLTNEKNLIELLSMFLCINHDPYEQRYRQARYTQYKLKKLKKLHRAVKIMREMKSFRTSMIITNISKYLNVLLLGMQHEEKARRHLLERLLLMTYPYKQKNYVEYNEVTV